MKPAAEIKKHSKSFIQALKSDRQTQIVTGIIAAVIILGVFFLPGFFEVPKGTWRYGVCKAFIERNLQYPSTGDVLVAVESSESSTIYVSKRNAFGDETLQLYECSYGRDEQGRLIMKQVLVNDEPFDPAIVEAFSKTIPSVMSAEMDLELPQGFSLDITKFKDRNARPLDGVYGY